MKRIRVGMVGGRGFVGAELLSILADHPNVDLAWATSKGSAGAPIPSFPERAFCTQDVAIVRDAPVDAIVLALPNGESDAWAAAAQGSSTVLVDISADHRFDRAWVYGQPERFRDAIRGAKRIAAPGCYATAAQLAIAPLVDVLDGRAHVFGVSGYSGAGATRSERNDPEVLRDNLLPYSLIGHTHERELREHGIPACFMPHVAPYFRGLTVTVSATLKTRSTPEEVSARFAEAYRREPFVTLTTEPPRPRDSVGDHGVRIGGISVDEEGTHCVVVAALDNLLGGAASQAVRGLNLAVGLDEATGVARRRTPS